MLKGPRGPSLVLEFNALTGATVHERLIVAASLARKGGRAVRKLVAVPSRAATRIGTRPPQRLLIAPQDIRTSDPTIAADIGAGYFVFGGKAIDAAGRSPFGIEAESDGWVRQLASFGWLRHLRAADSADVRSQGRTLVDDFIRVHAKASSHPAWEAPVVARRVLSWLSQSPVVLEGADRSFYNRFLASLLRQRLLLERQVADELVGTDRLLAAIALAAVGLCFEDDVRTQKRGSDALAAEISRQVLPDGGHVGRNPQMLIDLLLDLLPLRQAYAARGIQAPTAVLNAIDRMIPMLRLFRHGDGNLALFNGMGATAPELVATILSYDDARAQPLTNARQSGYQRVEAANNTILIVDSGPAPPRNFSKRAHAGCLSFELSTGAHRLVVNCGKPESDRPEAREAARTTAAHSTLVIDDASSCRFAGGIGFAGWLDGDVLSGPRDVTVERMVGEESTTLLLSHDGYARRFGTLHHRTLDLAADGSRLSGRDSVAATPGRRGGSNLAYAIRFHLHPSVRVEADTDRSALRLHLPNGDVWRFEADLAALVEPSILFAAAGGPRATTQIRLATRVSEATEVRWCFRRIHGASQRA